MQEVAHKIHIKKNGAQYDVNLYNNKFPSPTIFFPVKISGTTYYLPATSYLSGDAAGGSTPLRIKKGGTTYQIIKKAECNINIPTYDNQKIVVEVTNSITGNKAAYEKTVVVPFGSSFTAKVQSTNSQYNAGRMTSVSSGTITEKNINLTASPATLIVPTGSIYITYNTKTFTVPQGVNRIKCDGSRIKNRYILVPNNRTFVVTWNKDDDGFANLYINNVLVDYDTASRYLDCTVSWGPSINA